MKRIWGSVCSATIALAGSALLMPACNHPDASIFIVGVIYPPAPSTSGCMYPTPSATTPLLTEGIVDVAVAGSYQELVIVGNQILAQSDPTSDKAETSRVNLNKVSVHVTTSQGELIDDYSTQVDGFLDVGSSGTPGYGSVQAELIGGPAYAYLAAQARATPYVPVSAVSEFYFTGTTLGDVTVQSNTFSYPVSVCYGCLASFANDVGGACNTTPMTTLARSCFLGEDNFYDCSLCADPICAAPNVGFTFDGGVAP
jgi:hypothetical protein